MTYFQIGSLSVPATWLTAITAFLIVPLLYRVLTKKQAADWYWNSVFLYILFWKLSYIPFNLGVFVDMPLSIIYFNGGTKGHILVLVILSMYLLLIAPKKFPTMLEEASIILLLYFICYEVIINSMVKNYIEASSHFLLLISFLFLLRYLKTNGSQLSSKMFILFILLELLILSIFQTIFSIDALTFIWIAIIVFFLCHKKPKGDQSIE